MLLEKINIRYAILELFWETMIAFNALSKQVNICSFQYIVA